MRIKSLKIEKLKWRNYNMPITSYPDYMNGPGKAGQLSNYQDYKADTEAAEEVIYYGRAVQLNAAGTAVTNVKTGGTVIGIAMLREGHDFTEKKDDQKYETGDPVAIVKQGLLFVVAGGDVIKGQAVKVDVATGKFSTDAAVAVPSAVFKGNATAEQLVEIEIQLP